MFPRKWYGCGSIDPDRGLLAARMSWARSDAASLGRPVRVQFCTLGLSTVASVTGARALRVEASVQ